MKTFTVSFHQRIELLKVAGLSPGPAAHVRAMSRILDRITFTEEEAQRLKVNLDTTKDMFLTWDPDAAKNEQPIELSLEDADAAALAKLIEGLPQLRPILDKWLLDLAEKLK